ncbi:PP2C family protein-serine/threonine phosphatase [Streptomyces iconiensis]|uniref:PP2C family protein-serine/threonine phosphatase n=1 Tax=Streptomyces iconiensis TaxID=1384038 RepID=A0ABT7A7L5_9ACTN|nr:PP2C family protein-serine/threonine phosphatase [Streptomyces iconiensis]MDJ1137329.1 PP2C family protein-serine/threonine phosphatase [Streptomyces iconiensis]
MREKTGDNGNPLRRHSGKHVVAPTGVLGGRRGRYVRLVPAALIVLGTLIELTAAGDVTVSALFAAAPVVAAALQSARATLITGILATCAIAALSRFYEGMAGLESEARVLTVVTVSVIAMGVNAILRRSVTELASVRTVAEAVQLAVLPGPPTRIGDLAVATHYRAAQADARIGGDFYAVEETPHGLRLLLGDVRGKGLGAVRAVVIVVGAFREAAEQEATLAGVAARLDKALQREGKRQRGAAESEGFTTAVLVEIPDATQPPDPGDGSRTLRLVNRGHPGPILLDDGQVSVLEAAVPALPLGMTELGVWPDRTEEFRFPPGAFLLLYTDGLSEARDEEGAFYEPHARLAGRHFPGPDRLLGMLVEDVAAHTGGTAEDDMALLALAHGSDSSVTVRSGKGQPG